MDVKRCSRCGEVKSVDEFYRDKRKKDGLRSCCRDCTRAANRAWGVANLEKKRAASRAWSAASREVNRAANQGVNPYDDPTTKTCSSCKRELPRTEFSPNPSRSDGLDSRCRPCAAVGKKTNACPDCGVACVGERCWDCAEHSPGGYNSTTVGRRPDRWSTETNLYIKLVTDSTGTKHWKIGIGTLERANDGGALAVCLAMPLARALYIEQRVLAVHGYQVDKDVWPMKGGHTECVSDFGLMFNLRHAPMEEVETWLAAGSSDEELADAA